MSSSSDEDVLACFIYHRLRKKKRYWRHPYIERNINCRLFVAAKELSMDDEKFLCMYRMSKETYEELLSLIAPAITKQNTRFRECINADERLLITLRYLGTGSTFSSLALYFARGVSSISGVIAETTEAIWTILEKDVMAIPSTEKWKEISNRFYELWNMPNCLGAMDGKHIRIQQLPNSGSTNYNYKGYHSIVLFAVCDAEGLFTMVDTGYAGRNSDGGVFKASALSYWLERDGINIPTADPLPHDTQQEVPYFFVADNAFPLTKRVMRPYPMRRITNEKRIYNYRHSRARKTIECAFGMMTQKFQVFLTPIRCFSYTTIISIIKSACVLHNFIRLRDGKPYSAVDFENITQIRPFNFQQNLIPVHPNSSGATVRKYLTNYFITPQGALPWQNNHCV